MPCLSFQPGATLPTLPAGLSFTVPGFTPPTFSANLCCKISIPIPLPALPPIPLLINPAFIVAINAVIGQVQAFIDQLDALQINCPLESAA
jgi:hypothetical protein